MSKVLKLIIFLRHLVSARETVGLVSRKYTMGRSVMVRCGGAQVPHSPDVGNIRQFLTTA